jgi:4-carboxymuconolactone decarboxylase
MAEPDLRDRGLAIRKQLWPDREGGIAHFRALDPAFADFILEHGYGEIYGDPTLDLQTRSLLTCAALAVLGRAAGLESHLRGALNIGITPQKLIAMLKQMGLYAGFATINEAFRILKVLLDERNHPTP